MKISLFLFIFAFKLIKMIKTRIGTALKYFKNQFELAVFRNNKNCDDCCDLYEYETAVVWVDDAAAYAFKNTDSADLLPYNHPGRSGVSAVHYITTLHINNVNVFNNVNLFTDAFRRVFTNDSIGNRNELDFTGNTPQNANSWIKNYNNFVNSKIQSSGLKAYHYTNYNVKVSTNTPNETTYIFKCYVVVPRGIIVDKIQQSRWDTEEMLQTNWVYNPIDAVHGYPATLIKQVNCNLI